MMCNKAGMQYPAPTAANGTIPCNITVAQYTSKINGCSDKIVKMWQANKADTGTCGEYKTAKACVSKFIHGHCQVSGDIEQMMKLYCWIIITLSAPMTSIRPALHRPA
ncbi:hypothetical protein QZH41_015144, partial [Actinostola sp. cb2023]